MEANTVAKRPFGMRDNLAYAAGDFGCNMSFALKGTLVIFWTQYMGMDSLLYAALLLIVQVWDAINDPLIGALIDADRRRYKLGKFKACTSSPAPSAWWSRARCASSRGRARRTSPRTSCSWPATSSGTRSTPWPTCPTARCCR